MCLVVPDPIALKKYAEAHNLSGDPGTLSRNRDVQGMIGKEISRSLAGKYGGYEIPKKFVFIHEPFSVDNGMITQTMKMKRKVILDKHMPEIEALYSEA